MLHIVNTFKMEKSEYEGGSRERDEEEEVPIN